MLGVDYIINKSTLQNSHKSRQYIYDEVFKSTDSDTYLLSNKYNLILINQSHISREVDYHYGHQHIGKLPKQLNYLISSFKESESILLLEDDWDDNLSEKYSFETWKVAIQFVIDYSKTLFKDFNIQIDKPKIYNGPRGSIDILWEYDSYTLLINLDKNCTDVKFYGDNTINTQRVRGEFKLPNYKKTLIPFAIQF